MKKYIVRFNGIEVLAVLPVSDGSEILGTPQLLITSLERAKIMLDALGVDTTVLDEYQEPEKEEFNQE